ncbi:MAG: hypothetical protein GX572_04405 [Clostridia bacterium]|nr:hypothetical protein [Clostridia bacterium]
MKAYKEYLDMIAVDGVQHQRFIACAGDMRRQRQRQKIRACAIAGACLAIGLLAALGLPRLPDKMPAIGGYKLDHNATGLATATIIDGSAFMQEAIQTDSCYVVPQPGDCQFLPPLLDAMAYYAATDALLFVGVNIFSSEENLSAEDGAELQAEIRRLTDLGYQLGYAQAWTYQGQGERVAYAYLSGLFTVQELENFAADSSYGYSFYFAHNGDGSAVAVDAAHFMAAGDAAEQIDVVAAYGDVDFAAYLPRNLPADFAFESAYRLSTGEQFLSVLWSKGMAEIHWRVAALTRDDRARITSVAETQNYDLALYPAPRADSVPSALREIVTDPIFHSEELTLAVVEARVDPSGDAGDITGCRLRFGVAYGEILVEISVKGATAAEVFEMLRHINK